MDWTRILDHCHIVKRPESLLTDQTLAELDSIVFVRLADRKAPRSYRFPDKPLCRYLVFAWPQTTGEGASSTVHAYYWQRAATSLALDRRAMRLHRMEQQEHWHNPVLANMAARCNTRWRDLPLHMRNAINQKLFKGSGCATAPRNLMTLAELKARNPYTIDLLHVAGWAESNQCIGYRNESTQAINPYARYHWRAERCIMPLQVTTCIDHWGVPRMIVIVPRCQACGVLLSPLSVEVDRAQPQCDGCRYSQENPIADYNARVTTRPYCGTQKQDDPLCGVELEQIPQGDSDTAARAIRAALPFTVLCKRDGSVPNGFEVVTQPAPLSYWLQEGIALLSTACRTANCRSHASGSCGLHIHVENSAFSSYQLHRLIGLPKYDLAAQMLETLSRRGGENQYARIRAGDEGRIVKACKAKDFRLYGVQRYRWLNLSGHKTVEFRLWRGNLREDRIREAFHLILALRAWGRSYAPPSALPEFLKNYPDLWAHVAPLIKTNGGHL